MNRSALTLLLTSLLVLPCFRALSEEVADGRVEAVALTAADTEAIQKLFGRLGQAFLRGNSDDCLAAFAPKTAELRQVPQALIEEFSQTVYTRFEAVEFRSADAEWLRPNVWIVDVVLILENAPKHVSTELQKKERAYRTSYPFIVQRMPDGSFLLRHSEFFQTLGLRRGLPGLMLRGAGLIALVAALLSFWVWMGWEAWRERPRAFFWRKFVLVPGLGALTYFLFRLLPRWLTKKSA